MLSIFITLILKNFFYSHYFFGLAIHCLELSFLLKILLRMFHFQLIEIFNIAYYMKLFTLLGSLFLKSEVVFEILVVLPSIYLNVFKIII